MLSASPAVGLLVLLVLLWQVASQNTLRSCYPPIILGLPVFLAGSAALGWLLTAGLPRDGGLP